MRWLPLLLLLAGPAAAEDELPRHPAGPLQEIAYGFAVAEYCGLATIPVAQGYDLLRRWTILQLGLTPAQVRGDDRDGGLAADYQYGNHGLAGFRFWCRDDGLPAARRFLQFRATVLGR
ncbi:MAG: hypothetical protein U1E53_23175 [Dongiaceae bacterium]